MAIHQKITFKCSPAVLYKALTTSSDFAAATGEPAELSAAPGDPFSLFNGQITGRNVELLKDQIIVQAWRVGFWPAGVYSIVRFTLEQTGNDTELTLEQSGHPDDATEHLESGWHNKYWDPLKTYCE